MNKFLIVLLLATLTIATIFLSGVEADTKVSASSNNQTGCKTALCKVQKSVQAIASKFTVRQVLIGIILVLGSIAIQQHLALMKKKGSLPGPSFVPPFFGMLFQLILTPFAFYENQEKYGPVSWTSILNKFVLFVTDAETTRQVFKDKNSKLYLSLNAKKILTERAIPYIDGVPHQQLRKQLLPLFTIRALGSYLPIQESIIQEQISEWLAKDGGNINAREKCRDLNMSISTGVFCGQNTPLKLREEIASLFFVMNEGFLAFPVDLPGTGLRKAINARIRLVEIFTDVIKNSRTRMTAGESPQSLIDLWVEYYLTCEESERNLLTDETIIYTLLSFMFASQDAMSSALVWVVRLLGEHKDILARVREEQFRLRPTNTKLDLETMRQATFTRQVVNEILRFRPPAVMVPHENIEDIVIGDNVVVPKGTMILPSIWSASFQEGSFKDPHTFDPDRFGSERKEEITCAKNYLVFGAGPHYCIGKELAKNQIEIFLTQMAMNVNWKLNPTEGGDEIIFGPTIFPKDGCNATLTPRTYSA